MATKDILQNYSKYDFAQFIGFPIIFRFSLPDVLKQAYEPEKKAIESKFPELIHETIIYFERTEKSKDAILSQLTDFLIINNLGLLPESSHNG